MKSQLVMMLGIALLMGAGTTAAQTEDSTAAEPTAALQNNQHKSGAWSLGQETPLTLGIFSGDEGVFGQADILLPLYREENRIIFFSPRVSMNDSHQEETNLGIGMRQLINCSQPFILGANLYYDGRWTRYNNRFDQVGLGLELLSSRFDLRANYYLPEQDKYRIDSVRTETVSVREYVSRTTETWFEPYAVNNQIMQDYGERITTRRKLVTETSWQIFDRYESALEGFDAEAGWRLPLLEAWADTRLFIGYQYFDNPFGDDYKGAKGRLEIRLFNDLLTLDAHVYEDEDLNLTDYIVGARLRLPLGLPNEKPALQQPNGADLAARMTEMVMRDPKVQTRESSFIANTEQRGTTTESQTTVSRQTRTEGTAVVMDDVVFVDEEEGSDANPGTAEDPMATIQAGIDNAFGIQNVFVFEGNYNTVLNVTEGVTLMGSGCPIQANGVHSYGNGIYPVVNGGGAASVITMENNTQVQGFEIVNGGSGNGIFSSAENLIVNCNYIHDTLVGVRVSRVGDLNVVLANNTLVNNSTAGAWISGTGASGSYFVNARGNTFNGNGLQGLRLTANSYDEALAILSGNEASGNTTGIDATLNGEFVSLLSIADTDASNNTGVGIQANVNSDNIAAALVGVPTALLGLAGDVSGMPVEMQALLTAGGPVTANNNGGHGIDLNIQGGMIGAAALFDVQASGNATDGAHIDVAGDIGIGLVASSENTMELLQFGTGVLDLLGLDLGIPTLPASPLGPCVFNNNGNDGLEMDVNADMLALGGVLGISAQQNGDDGIDLDMVATNGASIGLLARAETLDNTDDGIYMNVEGDFLGLGAMFDARANNNGDDGVDFGVYSGDIAIGLMASSDLLYNIADLINAEAALDPPLEIPGERWGPFEASGNGDYGIYADVVGDDLAAGIFLDTRTDSNQNTGFSADIWSEFGTAIGLAASSDTLFEILPPLLGDLMFDDPDAITLPTYSAMGPMTASGNGNSGFELMVEGEYALGLIGGLEANNNLLGSSFIENDGNGVYLGVTATDGEALAAMYDVTANFNAEQGIDVYVESQTDDAILALLNVEAQGNADEGIRVDMDSSDDTFIFLAGADIQNNGMQGVAVSADAGLDFGMAISAANANGNAQQGLLVNATAGGASGVLISPTAVDDFRAVYGSYDFLGSTNAVYTLMPSGPSDFTGNGGADTELNL